MIKTLTKFLGPLLAIAGVLGLTGSSILWNFQGRNLGIPATAVSLLLLAVGVVLLRPLQPAATAKINEIPEVEAVEADSNTTGDQASEKQSLQDDQTRLLETEKIENGTAETTVSSRPSITTAEAIAAELAEAELNKPDPVLVNFAPDALRPGNSIRPNKRQPGSNLSGFRDMASDLFKSN